jgi:hypothetical protein
MSAVQPYFAWYFPIADDFDEVEAAWRRQVDAREEDGSHLSPPDAVYVEVIAAEVIHGYDHVWYIRDGLLRSGPSWQVRRPPT